MHMLKIRFPSKILAVKERNVFTLEVFLFVVCRLFNKIPFALDLACTVTSHSVRMWIDPTES